MVKATFGTGGFLLLNTGETATPSQNRLLTTVAYQWKGGRAFALEGAIFSAGATVQWLRDGLGVMPAADGCDGLAQPRTMDSPSIACRHSPGSGRLTGIRMRAL